MNSRTVALAACAAQLAAACASTPSKVADAPSLYPSEAASQVIESYLKDAYGAERRRFAGEPHLVVFNRGVFCVWYEGSDERELVLALDRGATKVLEEYNFVTYVVRRGGETGRPKLCGMSATGVVLLNTDRWVR